MAAYILGEIEVTDAAAYEAYRREVPAIIGVYGNIHANDASTLKAGGKASR